VGVCVRESGGEKGGRREGVAVADEDPHELEHGPADADADGDGDFPLE
jgi:hypothetical protein